MPSFPQRVPSHLPSVGEATVASGLGGWTSRSRRPRLSRLSAPFLSGYS